jgi:hypothetical protein
MLGQPETINVFYNELQQIGLPMKTMQFLVRKE